MAGTKGRRRREPECTCTARRWDPDCEVHETRAEWRQDDELHDEEERPRRREEGGASRSIGATVGIPWEELTDAQKARARREYFGPDEDETGEEGGAGKEGGDGKGGGGGRERAPSRRGYFGGGGGEE